MYLYLINVPQMNGWLLLWEIIQFMSRHNWKSNPNCPRQSDMGINLIIVIRFPKSKIYFTCKTLACRLHLHKNVPYQYTRDDIMRLVQLTLIEIMFCFQRKDFLFYSVILLATVLAELVSTKCNQRINKIKIK